MKVHTAANRYVNPRKNRRVTASERRGREMLRGCFYADDSTREPSGVLNK